MQRRSFNKALLSAAAALTAGTQGVALAQAWPARPISLQVQGQISWRVLSLTI